MRYILCAAYHDAIRLGKDDSGVAFVLTLGVFMLMFMLCCGVYAIGDTVRQKIELQNAADAAAYSAAVVQADTLSRIATINRAMAWTYVQMTRRQLDFITNQWLQRTVKVWTDDYKKAKDWHNLSCFISPTTGTFKIPGVSASGIGCDMRHNRQQHDTYWVGIDEYHHGWVRINGLSSTFDSYVPGMDSIRELPGARNIGIGRDLEISKIVQANNQWNLFTRLAYNSGNRLAMNVLYSDVGTQILFDKLNINAMNIAELDLVIHMPERIKNAVHDILKANLPANLVEDGYYQYYLYQNEYPYSYFRLLSNTKNDERIFLSFADYYDEQNKTFRGDPALFSSLSNFMSSGEIRLMDTLGIKIAGGVDRWFVRGNGSRRAKDSDSGIQRCYKMWGEDILKSLHPSKHLPFLPPTNFNFNGDDNLPSKLTGFKWNSKSPYPSIGLYSEWRWYSMIWFCYSNPIIPWYPMNHKHTDVCSMFWCNHTSLNAKITKDRNCIIWPQNSFVSQKSYRKRHGLKMKKHYITTGGKSTTACGLPVIGGYTRVYGDDEMILAQHKEKYIGAKCLPLILSPTFFGKPGSLVVGVSRKNRNPWSMIMDACGIFKAFEPGVSHMWAVSAARAGYRKVDGGVGEYHLGWTDPSNNRERWNLKQPDWDAVFLPVRDAWKLCAWNMFTPGIFSGDDKILEDLMTSSWAGKQGWNKLKAPPGMHNEDSDKETLNWSELSNKLTH